MPRDVMNSLIQKIARQARLTFRGVGSSGDAKSFAENVTQLRKLVSEIRAEDLKIHPRSSAQAPASPPVTYMHICETDGFSMGVFLLKGGSSIPLHDHPGMHGMLKVLYGKVLIRGFDKAEAPPPGTAGSVLRAVLRSTGEYSDSSPPCLLSPHRDNLHQISAVDGPAAFLDILAPPYDPEDGRDCHYYKLLPPSQAPSPASPEQSAAGASEAVWLLEIPQPDDFWCGGEPYPGPIVSV
ncbi:2-aminoethanethiol dioxygenase [Anomaloglossus baeobatrachus]|uniref:2-aminoethanethiol dioxygenase n=1 Tax=Anomaloglossus baeobatrachus TaxID=238106 RepID=UPI003F4FCDD6